MACILYNVDTPRDTELLYILFKPIDIVTQHGTCMLQLVIAKIAILHAFTA